MDRYIGQSKWYRYKHRYRHKQNMHKTTTWSYWKMIKSRQKLDRKLHVEKRQWHWMSFPFLCVSPTSRPINSPCDAWTFSFLPASLLGTKSLTPASGMKLVWLLHNCLSHAGPEETLRSSQEFTLEVGHESFLPINSPLLPGHGVILWIGVFAKLL